MTAQTLDGRAVSAALLVRVREEAADFVGEHGRVPMLVTVLVGDDSASHTGPMTIATCSPRPSGRHETTSRTQGRRRSGKGIAMARAKDNYLLDLEGSRRGYAINRLCGSLKGEENRRRFSRDEATYCDAHGLSPEQKKAILERDWIAMLDLGASIFYTFKLAMLDGRSMQYLGGVFTGMSAEEFAAALRSGGRSFG